MALGGISAACQTQSPGAAAGAARHGAWRTKQLSVFNLIGAHLLNSPGQMRGPETASLRLVVLDMFPATQKAGYQFHGAWQRWEFTSLPVTLVSVLVESEEVALRVTSAVSLTVMSCTRYLVI